MSYLVTLLAFYSLMFGGFVLAHVVEYRASR